MNSLKIITLSDATNPRGFRVQCTIDDHHYVLFIPLPWGQHSNGKIITSTASRAESDLLDHEDYELILEELHLIYLPCSFNPTKDDLGMGVFN